MSQTPDIDYDDRAPVTIDESDPREPDEESVKHDREVLAEQKREQEFLG